ncbi:MAG: tyrosine-type recombinase/integrase [Planctomycetota bacterium]
MFEADQVRTMLEAAKQPLRTMILLGINCGLGNHDCATLPLSALDLEGGWMDFPRPKTAIERRGPLWPETVAALEEAIAARPEPQDEVHSGLVFMTKYRQPWFKEDRVDSPITKETAKVLKALGIHRKGVGFYALRHTFEAIGGEARDQIAVDAIMGHARDDMASVYRERISDERLIAVTNSVHKWLFGDSRSEANQATN